MKFIFDLHEAAVEARGQKWTKTFVKGTNNMEIFLQTEFQRHWTKDKEMKGIFQFCLKSTRPDHCEIPFQRFLKQNCVKILPPFDKKSCVIFEPLLNFDNLTF